jgi:ABC-2 type transport system permease protein
MLRLIRSDLYRLTHRAYLFIFTGVLSALAVTYNLLFPTDSSILDSLQDSLVLLSVLPFLAIVVVDVVMVEESKFGTLKNVVSSGLSRSKLFVGKLAISVVLMLCCAAAVFAIYLGSAFVFRGSKGLTSAYLRDYLLRILLAVLLVIGALTVAAFFAVAFPRNAVYAVSFLGAMLILPLIFEGIGQHSATFFLLYRATIFGQALGLSQLPEAQFYEPILVSLLHAVVFGTAAGIVFLKQDVK